jgi:prepilin-type N-terminal cleavage/methylation domain-containing protein
MNRDGFTLVEVIFSVVILAVALLGLGASAGSLIGTSEQATLSARALNAVEERLSRVRMHPMYAELDSLFSESGAAIPELPGFTRDTDITRIRMDGEGEKVIDFTRVSVSVEGPGLSKVVSRTMEVTR